MGRTAALARPIVALLTLAVVSTPVGAAALPGHHHDGLHVRLLPTLGGSASSGVGINDVGWVAGSSNLGGDAITRAALWRHGQVTDLGTLGGANSAVVFPGHDNRSVIGVAEKASVNPDHEDWSCAAFFAGAATGHDCVGFVWEHGHQVALSTLGGRNGFAAGANRFGQVVGWAENGRLDPTCTGTQVRQFRAVLWDAWTHRPHELSPLPGDSTSAAVAINDLGQVVGISGDCGNAVGGVSARHAVLWDRRGRPHDLGNIGGSQWNTPVAINDRGTVVGFANVPGGTSPAQLFPNAFVWTAGGGMRSLHTLPGDVLSEAGGINNRGQIVGESCQAHLAGCRATLWQDGQITTLDDLDDATGATLVNAGDINDAGVITGTAALGDSTVAYVGS